MNNIEQNSLRIAELKDAIGDVTDRWELIEFFSSYDGLMPLVFECNNPENWKTFAMLITIGIDYTCIDKSDEKFWQNIGTWKFERNNEQSKIEAIQLAVIKYLELKNA